MRIFNSLGSNYKIDYLLTCLRNIFTIDKRDKLKKLIEKRYGGKVILFYKGREAIEFALNILIADKRTSVVINGLTCFVVEKSVTNARLKPIFLDIGNDLNFSTKLLIRLVNENKSIKAVIIQNTLGTPNDIEVIKKICRENNVILIEDLAHSVGSVYNDGSIAGTVGDFVTLSFSQDKVVDSISGGALVIRNKNYIKNIDNHTFYNVSIWLIVRDMLYPFFTYLIRNLYYLNFGKFIHKFLKQLNLLSAPIYLGESENKFHNLPKWHTNMTYNSMQLLDIDLSHRKKIAKIYSSNLDKRVILKEVVNKLNMSSNVRFPIIVNNRSSLIRYLDTNGVFVSDIWYDYTVAPVKYRNLSTYEKGMCPNAERYSEVILNLPTHKNVTEIDAVKISKLINIWLDTQ